MKVTQEKLPASQIGLEIEIPADVSQNTYDRTLQKFKQAANIPGFRKGKVPQQVLIKRLGPRRLKAAALEETIEDSLKQAIEQENIEALGNYQLRTPMEELVQKFDPGQPLTFSIAVDVPPEVNVENYDGLDITAEEVVYDPKRVEEFFEEHRNEQANLIPVEDRPAQAGDVLTVDYIGKLPPEDGEGEPVPFEGGQAEDTQMDLVEGRFIEGFVENIVGMSIDETKDFEVKFPDEYPNEELAGKPAIFTVTVKDIKERELPELDDDFAQAVSDFDTMEELQNSIETRFKDEAEQKTKSNIEAAVLESLLECVDVDLPQTMVDREIEVILTQTAMQLQQYGMDVRSLYTEENLPQMRERSRPEAVQKLKQDLALEKIADLQELKPTEAEIAERSEEILEELSDRDVDPERLRGFVEKDLVSQKALDWLREHAKIDLVPEGSLAESEDDDDATDAESAPEAEGDEADAAASEESSSDADA